MQKRRKNYGGRTATWREILVHLCSRPLTAVELAGELGISGTAVREHLRGMGEEGLVRHHVERRGVGKPTHVYELTTDGLVLLSTAYAPVLAAVLEGVEERGGADQLAELLGAVGRSLAGNGQVGSRSLRDRVEAAATELEKLGGAIEIAETDTGYSLQGRCCPLGYLTPRFPSLCHMVERMLEAIAGGPVREACHRGVPPRCRFEIRYQE